MVLAKWRKPIISMLVSKIERKERFESSSIAGTASLDLVRIWNLHQIYGNVWSHIQAFAIGAVWRSMKNKEGCYLSIDGTSI
jgi:hypothetical protein